MSDRSLREAIVEPLPNGSSYSEFRDLPSPLLLLLRGGDCPRLQRHLKERANSRFGATAVYTGVRTAGLSVSHARLVATGRSVRRWYVSIAPTFEAVRSTVVRTLLALRNRGENPPAIKPVEPIAGDYDDRGGRLSGARVPAGACLLQWRPARIELQRIYWLLAA